MAKEEVKETSWKEVVEKLLTKEDRQIIIDAEKERMEKNGETKIEVSDVKITTPF